LPVGKVSELDFELEKSRWLESDMGQIPVGQGDEENCRDKRQRHPCPVNNTTFQASGSQTRHLV